MRPVPFCGTQKMNDEQLLRYSRHILLDDIGITGQERLLQARVLVIGAGGLGSPAAMYLAAAGIGKLTIVDDDTVDLTNLQRQIMHGTDSVGMQKVASARQALGRLNPEAAVVALAERVDASRLDELVPHADVVLDCCDNFATRHAVNAACVRHRVPLVWAAAVRFEGQVGVYDPRVAQSPCYGCVYPAGSEFEEERCATMGVFAPLVGIVGAAQAAEALKLLTGAGNAAATALLAISLLDNRWEMHGIDRDPSCTTCGGHALVD